MGAIKINVLETIKSFIDKIFSVPISFLELVIEKIDGVQMVTAQGLNIGQYFAVFGDLPGIWQTVISSILISTVLLGTLLTIRTVMRMYYAAKEGVKWW